MLQYIDMVYHISGYNKFAAMGKRLLRFDQRKNHERLKYAPKSLTVSVPLSNSVMAFRVSLPLRYSSLYMTSPATNIATLHARIITCQVLSPG